MCMFIEHIESDQISLHQHTMQHDVAAQVKHNVCKPYKRHDVGYKSVDQTCVSWKQLHKHLIKQKHVMLFNLRLQSNTHVIKQAYRKEAAAKRGGYDSVQTAGLHRFTKRTPVTERHIHTDVNTPNIELHVSYLPEFRISADT